MSGAGITSYKPTSPYLSHGTQLGYFRIADNMSEKRKSLRSGQHVVGYRV